MVNFDINNIPAELKQLKQWVLWKLVLKQGAKKPTKIPYQTNGKPAITTDPNTWTDINTCLNTYKSLPDVYSGLGFVFAPNDGLTGVDFDHVIDTDTGEITPDVQRWINTFDSYTELSQSGEGCHIIVKGSKAAKRCKNSKLGYEIYDTGRYFVFTGNPMHTNLKIEHRQETINEFESYLITGQKQEQPKPKPMPTLAATSPDDIIEIAKRAKNGKKFGDIYSGNYTIYYSSQSEADLWLCSQLAFYCQGSTFDIDSYFRKSSLIRKKWDEKRGEKTYGQMTIDKAVQGCTAHYQPKQNGTAGKKPITAKSGIKRHNPNDDSSIIKKKKDEIYLVDTDNVYMTYDGITINGKQSWYSITNFAIIPKYLISDDKDNFYWVIELKRGEEPSEYIQITNEAWGSVTKLRNELRKKQYIFKGKDDELVKFQEAIGKTPNAVKVDVLGFNNDCKGYFFSNVCIKGNQQLIPNEFNIVEIENNYYYMPYVEQTKSGFKNAKRFIFMENKIKFNQWANLIFDAHLEAATIPISFYISSLFRDMMFNELHFCPILYIKGVRGSGKSSLIRNITALFGYRQHEISLKSPNTTKSLPRLLGQLSNAILWLDEYHNGLNDDIKGMLQSVYDGGGYEKAAFTTGIETQSVAIRSMLALTSNYLPEDDIFFSRCALIQMNETKKTQEQRKAYKEVTNLEKYGLSAISADILQHRDFLNERWKKYYEYLFNLIQNKLSGNKADNRYIENMAAIITPAYILLKYKKIRFNSDIQFHEKLIDIAVESIVNQNKITDDNSEILTFWSVIQMGYENEQIRKGVDFKYMNGVDSDTGKQEPKAFLIIRFQRLFTYYTKQVGFNKAQSKQEIKEMILNHESFYAEKSSVRFIEAEPWSDKDVEIDNLKKKNGVSTGIVLNSKVLSDTLGVIFE